MLSFKAAYLDSFQSCIEEKFSSQPDEFSIEMACLREDEKMKMSGRNEEKLTWIATKNGGVNGGVNEKGGFGYTIKGEIKDRVEN